MPAHASDPDSSGTGACVEPAAGVFDVDPSGTRRCLDIALDLQKTHAAGAVRHVDRTLDVVNRETAGTDPRAYARVFRHGHVVADADIAVQIVVAHLPDPDGVAALFNRRRRFDPLHTIRGVAGRPCVGPDARHDMNGIHRAGIDLNAARPGADVELDGPADRERPLECALDRLDAQRRHNRKTGRPAHPRTPPLKRIARPS